MKPLGPRDTELCEEGLVVGYGHCPAAINGGVQRGKFEEGRVHLRGTSICTRRHAVWYNWDSLSGMMHSVQGSAKVYATG